MVASGVDLLHDPTALLAADGARLVPGAAMAGAQVRALVDQRAQLPALSRPRALVVIGQLVDADVAMLQALAGTHSAAPIVAAQQVPAWLGALDVVVVLARQVYDEVAALAVDTAVRRGATVIVRCAEAGPVPRGGATVLPPPVAVPEALAGPARLSLLCAVATGCGLLPDQRLHTWADRLDAVATTRHPAVESFVNPALTLAEGLVAGPALLVGTDALTDAVSVACAQVLAELAGLPGAVLPSSAALASSTAVRRIAQGSPDMFADPYDRPPVAVPVLVATDPLAPAATAIARALPSAVPLTPDSAVPLTPDSAAPANHVQQGAAPGEPHSPTPGLLAAELLAGWTFAAVYLGLVAGQLAPLDAPDGLGRPGTALGAVRGEQRPTERIEEHDRSPGYGIFPR